MKLIIDAMGGDLGPAANVQAALESRRQYGEALELVLVGRGEALLRALSDAGEATLPSGIEIADAPSVVPMDADPTRVVHAYPDSSMVTGLRLLAASGGDAFVSAGNTGALISAATLLVKRIKGVRRAALGPAVPTATGMSIILDAGANAECTPEFLEQFAYMGRFCAERIYGVKSPRVGLLNIGAEPGKGTPLQKETFDRLQTAGAAGKLDFIGNVEARDVPAGVCDVVVCDGFSGNVLLKSIEGTAMMMNGEFKKLFLGNAGTKLAALLLRSGIRELKRRMDYREYGGSMLLGIQKPVIKAHGASDTLALRNAIRQAVTAVSSGIVDEIARSVSQE